jgi:hypothetical protein
MRQPRLEAAARLRTVRFLAALPLVVHTAARRPVVRGPRNAQFNAKKQRPKATAELFRLAMNDIDAALSVPVAVRILRAAVTVTAQGRSPGRTHGYERPGFSAATLGQRLAATAQMLALSAASEVQRPGVAGGGVEVDCRVVPAQVTAELVDPEEQVGVGGMPRGVELRQRRAAHRVDARSIDAVVPVPGHLLRCGQRSPLAGEVVAVGLDDLAQLRVSVQQRELDDGLRSRAAQPALLQQHALLLCVHQLADVDLRADLVVGLQPCDLGIDEVGVLFARQGDAMMAILDEVRAADLEDLDRRQPPSRNADRRLASRPRERPRRGLKSRSKSPLRSTEPTIRSIGISRIPRYD